MKLNPFKFAGTSLLLAATLLLNSCEIIFGTGVEPEPASTEPAVFVVNQHNDDSNLSFNAETQSFAIVVLCDVKWTARLENEDDTWIQALGTDAVGDNKWNVGFTIASNMGEARKGTVLFEAGSVTRRLEINQGGLESVFMADEVKLYGINSREVYLCTNSNWEITVPKDAWFTVSPVSGGAGNMQTIVFKPVDDNSDNVGERKAEFTVSLASGLEFNIPISQAQTDNLIVVEKNFTVPSTGGEVLVELLTNTGYTYSIDSDWVTPLTTKSLNTYIEGFYVEANPNEAQRVARISFTIGSITEVVEITQEKRDPFLSETRPGGYGINGVNYIHVRGEDQLSRLYKDGKLSMRLLYPAEVKVVSFSGIPEDPAVGDEFDLSFSVTVKGEPQIITTFKDVQVVHIDDELGLLYLKKSADVFFVIKK